MEPLESEKNIKYETVFEVWVEGSLGVHAHQPILHSVHESEPAARVYMKEFLEKGKFAAIKQIRRPSGPSIYDGMR
tara:strand:+ start:2159 stop:2386 length:228 start_codon:yes stop_codon:yes gene_type:complete